MKNLLIVTTIVSGMATSAFADSQTPYQVLRPGDNELSCETLSTEINSLNAEVLKLNEQSQKQAKLGRTGASVGKGVFTGLARGASIIGYGSTSSQAFAGLLASNVAAGVAQQVATDAASPQAPVPATPIQITPQQQRLSHLTGIYRGRSC
jgi:hypothetical protein